MKQGRKEVMLFCAGKIKDACPKHKQLALGTLRSAIRQAGLTVEEFIGAYEQS